MMGRNTTLAILASFVLGFVIGLFVFGWGLTPVRFTNGGPQHLSEPDLKNYVAALADAYGADGNTSRVRAALCNWDRQVDEPGAAAAAITGLAEKETDPAYQQRLQRVAALIQAPDCQTYNAQAGAVQPTGGSALGRILPWLLLLAALSGVAYFILQRRQSMAEETAPPASVAPPRVVAPAADATTATPVATEELEEPPVVFKPAPSPALSPIVGAEADITPLAGFETTYVRGDDAYDKSFIIENAQGDFLGECGVSISEVLSNEGARNVTAFEVWLFDKNDTHTVTKVVMSENAYHDDAFRAKLATRGEPVLAEPGEIVALETAALIINAEIAEVEYNSLQGAQNSVFDRLTIQLSAWVKGDGAG